MATIADVDWQTELETLAQQAEGEALAKADDIFAEAVAEHERQTAGYSFECRRWGDFLTVYIERSGNESSYGEHPERKLATSLNISTVKEIRLSEGRCFDRRHTLKYRGQPVSIDKGSISLNGIHGPPGKGWQHEVRPNYPYIPKARPLLKFDPPSEDRHGMHMSVSNGGYRIKRKTENFPRPAEDDSIYFRGLGVTVYAPAGIGQRVYDAILAEVERGYERPCDSDTRPKDGDAKLGSTRE